MIRAHIFDFDGILADSEPLHFASFQDILAPLGAGFSWETYVEEYMHFDSRGVFLRALSKRGETPSPDELKRLVADKGVSFLQRVAAAPPPPFPGALEALRLAASRGPIALCTAAEYADVDAILRGFGVRDLFTAVVTADDVTVSKPDPSCYRLAVQRLGCAAGDCLAIEDTPGGLRAARGAGCQTLGVAQTHSPEQLRPFADRVVDTMRDFT